MTRASSIGNSSFSLNILKPLLLALFFTCAALCVFAQDQLTTSEDQKTLTVNDAPEMEVYAIGKSVIVKGRAKGVFAFGGDIVVEGRVDGDVATIGGSVVQKSEAYIGGDVMIVGGAYKPEAWQPLREPGKQTVLFGVFEDEIRKMAQDPTQIFAPSLSWTFIAWRSVLVLFWFVVTMVFNTLAPGAVSRAVARIHLSSLRVFSLGVGAFLLILLFAVLGFRFLPDYLGVLVLFMFFFLLLLTYVFGRVTMQVTLGKLIEKKIFGEGKRSEVIAILMGVFAWVALMSFPYVWVVAELVVFAAGIGLVLTASRKNAWQPPAI